MRINTTSQVDITDFCDLNRLENAGNRSVLYGRVLLRKEQTFGVDIARSE